MPHNCTVPAVVAAVQASDCIPDSQGIAVSSLDSHHVVDSPDTAAVADNFAMAASVADRRRPVPNLEAFDVEADLVLAAPDTVAAVLEPVVFQVLAALMWLLAVEDLARDCCSFGLKLPAAPMQVAGLVEHYWPVLESS